MLKHSTFYLLLLFSTQVIGQGHLLLVGGGAERDGGWSDDPYTWGIENASNNKVAVISYDEESEDLPDYFKSLGAVDAKNFQFSNSTDANNATLIDDLAGYDFFFFKGGDQFIYYENYKNSALETAIEEKFNAGGVIGGTSAGMAILSQVMFTAENGSVYPEEGLTNISSSRFALENDFLELFPNYIFDTHFIERGRPFRMMAFLANWHQKHQELLKGIGVDDQTALTIDPQMQAEVHGTGGVSFFSPSAFSYDGDNFSSGAIATVTLIDGNTIDLTDLSVTSGPTQNSQVTTDETGNYTVLLSGSDPVADNQDFLSHFAELGNPSDDIILVSPSSSTTNSITTILESHGASNVTVLVPDEINNNESAVTLRNAIKQAEKVLFAGNDDTQLINFLEGGITGSLLKAHLSRNNMVTGFIGEDSRYAGQYMSTNHISDESASYRNRLRFEEGIGLLKSSAIMSNTIDLNTSDYYENTTSSVTYQLAKYDLKYGIYINEESFIEITPVDGTVTLTTHGEIASVVVTNVSTVHGFAEGRNVTGFDAINYHVLSDGKTIDLATATPTMDEDYELEVPLNATNIHNNLSLKYSNGNLEIVSATQRNYHLDIFDLQGRNIHQARFQGTHSIGLSKTASDILIVHLRDLSDGSFVSKKLYMN